MPDRLTQHFPLFPLGLVALPHEYVPLHIFEDRYRTMMGECLADEREFGIVWAGDEGVRPVGCAMEITEILERMEDGRMNLLTRGTRPFRVLEETHDRPYPSATVEFLHDKDEAPDTATTEAAREAYASLVEQATDKVLDDEDLAAHDRLPDGGDRRLRARCQAGAARPALGERAAAAGDAAVPRGDEAPGLHRARAGAGSVEREGPLRLTRPPTPSQEPARMSTTPTTAPTPRCSSRNTVP